MNFVHRLIHEGADTRWERFSLSIVVAVSAIGLLTAATMTTSIAVYVVTGT